MIRDPLGGWDTDGIFQLSFMLACVLVIISLGAATSGNWHDPYTVTWSWIENNEALVIGMAMVLLLGLYWFHQFDTGRL
jgi:hypothetical protein